MIMRRRSALIAIVVALPSPPREQRMNWGVMADSPIRRRSSALSGACAVMLAMMACVPAHADLVSALNTFRRGDHAAAFPEFLALAKLGQPLAQLDIAYLYAGGVGTVRSNVRAYGWARLAGRNGEAKGRKLADKLRVVLTPAQRRTAARIVAPYTPAALRRTLLPTLTHGHGCGTHRSTHCRPGTWGKMPECSPLHIYRYVYPRGAAASGVQGRVVVHFTLMPNGTARLPYVVFGLPDHKYRFPAAVRTSILRSKYAHLPPGAQPVACNLVFSFVESQFDGLSAYPRLDAFLDRMRRRARSGDPRAQAIYGTLLATVPQVGSRRRSHFLRWLVKAARAGVALAQYEVGESQLAGMGCVHDPVKGLRWLHLAAAQGNPQAEVALAIRLLRGTPSAANWTRARRWFDAAVAHHDQTGAEFLAAMLATAPEASWRDPARALQLERMAFDHVGADPTGSEIRAAAYADEGHFKRAVHAERRALAQAHALGWALAPLRKRLARYRAHRDWFGNLLTARIPPAVAGRGAPAASQPV